MYQVRLLDEAKEELRKLADSNRDAARLVQKKLEDMEKSAGSMLHVRLSGDLADYFKQRVGDYRIAYTVDHQARTVTVYAISDRKDIYRKLKRKPKI